MVSHPTNNNFALSILKFVYTEHTNKRNGKAGNAIIITEKGCIIN